MANWVKYFSPELARQIREEKVMLEMGRNLAPNIQDPRLRGLLESDDIAKVQAGIGLFSDYTQQQQQQKLQQLIGQQSQVEPPIPGLLGQGGQPFTDYPRWETEGSGLLGGLEKNDPNAMRNFYAQLPALGGQYVKAGLEGLGSTLPKPEAVPDFIRTLEMMGIDRRSPEALDMLRMKYGPKTNVSVSTGDKIADAGTKKATEALGTGIGQKASDRLNHAEDARQQNMQFERIKLALASGAQTGMGAETLLNLKSLAGTVFGLEGTDKMGEQELIRSIGNQAALRIRNPDSGMGLPGATSNFDLQFLTSSIPGIGRTVTGNIKLIDFAQRLNNLKIEAANEQMRIIQENNGVVPFDIDRRLAEFVKNYKFFKPGEREMIERLTGNPQGNPQRNPRIDELLKKYGS